MRIFRTAPALLMLLLVTAGLFTMHTLGHVTMGESTHMSHGPATVDDSSHAAGAKPSDAPGMPMGSVVLCVAVLCGLTILAVAGLLSERLRLRGLQTEITPHAVATAGRGPPKVHIGLILADLSVWRN